MTRSMRKRRERRKTAETPKRRTSSQIALRAADNMTAAHAYAAELGRPLVGHLTVQWKGTGSADDPDGKRFAKFRTLLNKRLQRLKVPGGLTAIWVREVQMDKYADVPIGFDHCHMLFHLPETYRKGLSLKQIERIIDQLLHRVGDGIHDPSTFKLTFPSNPDGTYLLKGGTPAVWSKYGVRKRWCDARGQGTIDGKRCGTTQNIGAAARKRRETVEAAKCAAE